MPTAVHHEDDAGTKALLRRERLGAAMKRTPSYGLALANLVFVAVLVISIQVVLSRFDATRWVEWPRLLNRMEWGSVAIVLIALLVVPCAILALALFEFWSGFRRQPALATGIAVTLMLTLVLWVSYGDELATQQEERADGIWAGNLESMDAFRARYPEAPESEAALELRAVAARTGLDLSPDEGRRPLSIESDRSAFHGVKTALWAFVSSQTQRADDTLEAPPGAVQAWLAAHDAGVEALARQVREGGPIAFETDWAAVQRPVPSIAGMRDVAGVLIVRALERERLGDPKAAGESLEAAWRVGGALRDRGETISQLLAVSVDSMTLRALRKLRHAPQPWQSRIAEHDYSTWMLRALQGEAWTSLATLKRLMAVDHKRRRAARGLWFRIEGPVMLLMATDFSAGLGRMVGELKTADPCRIDPERLGVGALASWNLLGRPAMPSLVRAWISAEGAALEAELTRNVLAARELRSERGSWPTLLPGLESSVCTGSRWDYSVSADGTISLSMPSTPELGKALVFRAGFR